MSLHILIVSLHTYTAYVYLHTNCSHLKIFNEKNVRREVQHHRYMSLRESTLSGGTQSFFQICNNMYMCTHACVHTPMHACTQIFSLQATENKAHNLFTFYYIPGGIIYSDIFI